MDAKELGDGFKVGFNSEWSKHDEYVENCFIRIETPSGTEEIRPHGWVGWRNAQAFHVDADAKITHLYDCACRETEKGVEGEFEPMQNGDLDIEVEGHEDLPGHNLAREFSEDRDGIIVYVAMEVSDFGFGETNFEYFFANVFQDGERVGAHESGYM